MGESLSIASSTEAVGIPLVDPGTIFEVTDAFETSNQYHGGSIGLVLEHCGPWWSLEVLAKVGLGNMYEVVTISGQTVTTTPPPNPTTDRNDFGLLAQGVNLGVHSRNQFTVAPEFGVNFVFQLSECAT